MNYSIMNDSQRPNLALAITGSNITAIGAEIVAATVGYQRVMAITRRNTTTSLPIAMDGDEWGGRLKRLGLFGSAKIIESFLTAITTITGGQPFDCFLHHHTDPFSQLLSGHPLCRNYFYLEEGFTALIGHQFGRPKQRRAKRLLWKLKSRVCYGGRIDRFRSFFDTTAHNYGGAYALTTEAFLGLPGRVLLPFRDLVTTVPVPADITIFLDSQYLVGNCTPEAYTQALTDCLAQITSEGCSIAIKFHPAEKDPVRKTAIIAAIQSLPDVVSVIELPPSFVGERMIIKPQTKVVVSTTALGLYLGERGFETYTFAQRLASGSARFALVMQQIPAAFLRVCRTG